MPVIQLVNISSADDLSINTDSGLLLRLNGLIYNCCKVGNYEFSIDRTTKEFKVAIPLFKADYPKIEFIERLFAAEDSLFKSAMISKNSIMPKDRSFEVFYTIDSVIISWEQCLGEYNINTTNILEKLNNILKEINGKVIEAIKVNRSYISIRINESATLIHTLHHILHEKHYTLSNCNNTDKIYSIKLDD